MSSRTDSTCMVCKNYASIFINGLIQEQYSLSRTPHLPNENVGFTQSFILFYFSSKPFLLLNPKNKIKMAGALLFPSSSTIIKGSRFEFGFTDMIKKQSRKKKISATPYTVVIRGRGRYNGFWLQQKNFFLNKFIWQAEGRGEVAEGVAVGESHPRCQSHPLRRGELLHHPNFYLVIKPQSINNYAAVMK